MPSKSIHLSMSATSLVSLDLQMRHPNWTAGSRTNQVPCTVLLISVSPWSLASVCVRCLRSNIIVPLIRSRYLYLFILITHYPLRLSASPSHQQPINYLFSGCSQYLTMYIDSPGNNALCRTQQSSFFAQLQHSKTMAMSRGEIFQTDRSREWLWVLNQAQPNGYSLYHSHTSLPTTGSGCTTQT